MWILLCTGRVRMCVCVCGGWERGTGRSVNWYLTSQKEDSGWVRAFFLPLLPITTITQKQEGERTERREGGGVRGGGGGIRDSSRATAANALFQHSFTFFPQQRSSPERKLQGVITAIKRLFSYTACGLDKLHCTDCVESQFCPQMSQIMLT